MQDLITPLLEYTLFAILIVVIFFMINNRYQVILVLLLISPLITEIYYFISSNYTYERESIFSYVRVMVLCLCGVAGYYHLLKARKSAKIEIALELKIYFVFAFLAIVSIIYSINTYFTFIRSFCLIALMGILFGLYAWLNSERRHLSMINILFYVSVIILFVNIISAILFQGKAWLMDTTLRFRGLFTQPNTFGSFCMVSYPAMFWTYMHSRSFRKIAIFVTILVMIIFHIASGSRGSFISSLIMGILWLIIRKKSKVIAISFFFMIILAVLFQIRTNSLDTFIRNVPYENRFMTLTGRVEIWTESINLIVKRPFLGYGYDITAKIFDSPFALYKNANLAWLAKSNQSFHNGYITTALGLGFVGLSIWSFLLFSPPLRLIKRANKEFVLVPFSIMISCLILNFTEYSINPGSSLSSIFFWLAWTLSLRIIQIDKRSRWEPATP